MTQSFLQCMALSMSCEKSIDSLGADAGVMGGREAGPSFSTLACLVNTPGAGMATWGVG